jgi:hypothetical protein
MRASARIAAFAAALLCSHPALARQPRILVQSSPLAGFQYYGAKILWDEMREGDALALIREPDNRHDPFAVRVEWRGTKLGYLPRAENRDVAAEMDKGTPIAGRIGRMADNPNPWKRLRVDVFVGL